MKDRIKLIRKNAKLNQEDFAVKLGITRSLIAQVETGKCSISARTVKDICREFYVNEDWLLTGDGEMYSGNRDELAEIVSRFMDNENDEFNKLLLQAMRAYQELDDKNRKIILDFVKKLKE